MAKAPVCFFQAPDNKQLDSDKKICIKIVKPLLKSDFTKITWNINFEVSPIVDGTLEAPRAS